MSSTALDRVLGLEISLLPEGTYRCSYALVSRKGNAMEILDEKQVTGSLVKVLESLPRKYPLALALSGRGILHKQIQQTAENQSSLFSAAFPTIDKQDFYLQEYLQGNTAWISIIRKSLGDDILNKFRLAGLKVYALSLGGLPVVGLWEVLDENKDGFVLGGHVFTATQDGSFSAYGYNEGEQGPDKIKLAGSKFSSSAVLPYALAFQLFLHDRIDWIKTDCEDIDQAFSQQLDEAAIKKSASIFLFSLLGLLLVSFLVLSHYNQENATLSERAGHLSATVDQSDVLKKEISLQKNRLNKMGWNGGYNYAFLLNELGSSKPKLLNLTQVQFGEEKKDALRDQQGNLIKVSGETSNLTAVNNWIFMLKEKRWVRNVKLLRYQQDMDSEHYLFNLLIDY